MPPLKTLLLLLETSSVVDKKCHSLQLYYKRAPLYHNYDDDNDDNYGEYDNGNGG